MAYEFETPEFLKNASVNEIHNRMLSVLPDDLDKSELQYPWDLTRPVAIEMSRFKEFDMIEAIKLIFPMFASGVYLDYHAKARSIERKPGYKAIGQILVKSRTGAIITEGDQFATESVNNVPSVIFEALKNYEIPENGEALVDIICTQAGKLGNTTKNTIILKVTKNDNITELSNPEPTTGGIEPEDDESLQSRIVEYDQSKESSYVGSPSDFRRWAMEVNGVGDATVISATDDSGTVTIILTDGNGEPATETLCQSVYDHIMSPNDKYKRLANVNALLSVIPPETEPITISADIILKDSTVETVKPLFLKELRIYLQTSINDGEIRLSQIMKILSGIEGVYDFQNESVLLNGKSENIPVTQNKLPEISLSSITLTEIT